MDPLKFLRILLPTLCLFYSLAWSDAPNLGAHHESFGNSDYYLDLYFTVNPEGPLRTSPPREVKFKGFLVKGDVTETVTGVWSEENGKRVYRFQTSRGEFHGTLLGAHKHECEPRLHFEIDKKPGGILRAGFCPGDVTASL